MNVELISYTPDALELLLFTKQTRLTQTPGLLDEIKAWPLEKKMAELSYMLNTIQSSWEFVDYTFAISGVTRAFTHQLVRTRAGSYAQQSQRTVDMSGFESHKTGALLAPEHAAESQMWDDIMRAISDGYNWMVSRGIPPQDARGMLPTNVDTNIIVKFNLRTLSDMALLRLCTRTQGEYQQVFQAMRRAVIAVHPWTEPFIRVHCASLGVCAFPNYRECPIKGGLFNPETGHRWDMAEEHVVVDTGMEFDNRWGNDGITAKPYVVQKKMPVRPVTLEEQQQRWEALQQSGGYEAVPHHHAGRHLKIID